jgi:hypothetical protein
MRKANTKSNRLKASGKQRTLLADGKTKCRRSNELIANGGADLEAAR